MTGMSRLPGARRTMPTDRDRCKADTPAGPVNVCNGSAAPVRGYRMQSFGPDMISIGGTICERPLSSGVISSKSSAKVKFQGRPAARREKLPPAPMGRVREFVRQNSGRSQSSSGRADVVRQQHLALRSFRPLPVDRGYDCMVAVWVHRLANGQRRQTLHSRWSRRFVDNSATLRRSVAQLSTAALLHGVNERSAYNA